MLGGCLKRCEHNHSEGFRIFMALLAAGTVSSTVYMIPFLDYAFLGGDNLSGTIGIWYLAFVIAFAHAAILGIPIYLIAHKYGMVKWWFSIIAGFIIGIVPVSLIALGDISSEEEFFRFLKFIWRPGALGMSGGFAAWLVWQCLNTKESGVDS